MLLFNKPAETNIIEGWDQQFRNTLIKRCQNFIHSHHRRQKVVSKPKLWWSLQSASFKQSKVTESLSKCHGVYSQYIPINSNQSEANQLTQYFPYLKYLQTKCNAEYQVCIFKISETIQNSKDFQKWMNVSEELLVDLPIEELLRYYNLLLAKGPKILRQIKLKRKLKCKDSVLLYKVMEIRRILVKQKQINSHISISIDRGDRISLENLSKTMKNLFCPICTIYDCQKHFLPVSAISNNFEYIRQFDIRSQLQYKKMSALQLLHHLIIIYSQKQLPQESQYCSQDCYKYIDKTKWRNIQYRSKKRVYSPLFKETVKMGVELWYYNPCQIKSLFSIANKHSKGQYESVGSCSQLFSYFMQQYNLLQKLNFKFFQSEDEQLMNEAQMLTYSNTSKKPKKTKVKKIINSEEEYNSVCLHYFMNKEPHDTNCLSCDCQIRGYCLPSCGCSEQCSIKRIGCKCKGESTCWQNKCYCFKNSIVCRPETCHNCFDQEQEGKINWCHNNEKSLYHSKRTMIGQSTIKGSGLGLFAGEYILKGEFVIKYLGQIIQSISLQKLRQNLVENNLFYTFKLNKFETIDSRLFGNKARFINHSKEKANITPRTINLNEQYIIVFHALKDISQGEQLLFNYNGQGELSEFKQKFPFID